MRARASSPAPRRDAPGRILGPVIADAFSIDDILAAREALAILGRLPDRQRADLTLLVAGFSYVEIAELTGGRTYTNVNKHIAKARARVRMARLSENADRGYHNVFGGAA